MTDRDDPAYGAPERHVPDTWVDAEGRRRVVIRLRKWWDAEYLSEFLKTHGCLPEQHEDFTPDHPGNQIE
jgi:hypothetical protein